MYLRVKHFIFTALYLLLWARFFFLIGDPITFQEPRASALPIYTDWAPLIDMVYSVSSYITMPLHMAYTLIQPYVPQLGWFPYLDAYQIPATLINLVQANPSLAFAQDLVPQLQSPIVQQVFKGVFSWFTLLAILILRLINPLVDKIYDFLKNVIWNILIEFSFTHKKQAVYQQALEKRASELMKLNVEYRNLSKQASELQASVITDELTQVYNKRFFLTKILEEFQKAKQTQGVLSLIMMDIDHFKSLNDNHGHIVGDEVLKAVAGAAKKATPPDAFCCRFGGEEFAILMPGKRHEEALPIAKTVHQSVPMLQFPSNPEIKVTSSFGMVSADFKLQEAQALQKFEDFVKLADDELYRSKLNGRNQINSRIIE